MSLDVTYYDALDYLDGVGDTDFTDKMDEIETFLAPDDTNTENFAVSTVVPRAGNKQRWPGINPQPLPNSYQPDPNKTPLENIQQAVSWLLTLQSLCAQTMRDLLNERDKKCKPNATTFCCQQARRAADNQANQMFDKMQQINAAVQTALNSLLTSNSDHEIQSLYGLISQLNDLQLMSMAIHHLQEQCAESVEPGIEM